MTKYTNLKTPSFHRRHTIPKFLELFNRRKLIMLFVLVLSLSSFSLDELKAQNNYAQLVSISHVCQKQLGTVKFELIGDPNNYTYYWLHGPTELCLSGLSVGTYTLIVINDAGCKEEYEVEILDLNSCYHEVEIVNDHKNKCWAWINITVYNNTGAILDESSLDIVWNDGYPPTLSRYFYKGESFNDCVTIKPVSDDQEPSDNNCCIVTDCFQFEADPECRKRVKTRGPIAVNEFTRNGDNQFLELLVVGEGDCNETSDIRGFHIDDNNGYLIPANDLVSEFTLDNIGIDLGFLSFKQHDNWANVPTGSLIVIYPINAESTNDFPEDDPTDANEDGVYVLSAENDEYLRGKSSLWNPIDQETPYEGAFIVPTWELVNISPQADGIQVRYPDGEFSHGLSFGQTNFSGENQFPLWVTSASFDNCNCKVVGEDFLDVEQIKCDVPNDIEGTPGKANSEDNEAIIAYLKDCEGEEDSGNINAPIVKMAENGNRLIVYPNPFQTDIMIDYKTQVAGEVKLSLHTLDGSQIFQDNWECEAGKHNYLLNPNKNIPAGVLILRFSFPNGDREDVKITRIR